MSDTLQKMFHLQQIVCPGFFIIAQYIISDQTVITYIPILSIIGTTTGAIA
jgi:hypothetical protein